MGQNSTSKTEVSRRGFMRLAGIAAGSAGAAAVSLEAEPAKAAAQAEGTVSAGYRETEHVRTYYDFARL